MEGRDHSSVLEGSGDTAVAVAEACENGEAGGGSNNSGEEDKGRDDESDKNNGGNRWPRQETLALLKIRSDMDSVFKDSSLKGPLWEEVSRKLAELGYNRSAKKCKEKFENVYKYHKRTKEGRNGKAEGKTYRFFNEIEALENLSPTLLPPPKPPSTVAVRPWTTNPPPSTLTQNNITISSTTDYQINPSLPCSSSPIIYPSISPQPQPKNVSVSRVTSHPSNLPNMRKSMHLFTTSTSSSTASDEELGGQRGKRKRKWKDFFVKLTKEVIEKQEGMQMKFLEGLEKIEHQRVVREDAWRVQEMARINKEHEILVQEMSTATSKDAAVIAFLQNIMANQQSQGQTNANHPLEALPPLPPPAPAVSSHPPQPSPKKQTNITKMDRNSEIANPTISSSRWPKAEVEALIMLRTGLDLKYHENAPKGPLWEEISASMRKIGYNRNAKRCKEKWENINKYFKKVKESNRKRPEDSKTCPYFNQLDALYKEKSKSSDMSFIIPNNQIEPLMVQPQQQWPLPLAKQPNPVLESVEKENGLKNQQIEEEEEEDDENEIYDEEDVIDGESEEEEDEGGSFQIVTNKQVMFDKDNEQSYPQSV